MDEAQPITRMLRELAAGDRAALDHLILLLYAELRRLAKAQLRREHRSGKDPRKAKLTEMRFFGGMDVGEIAEVLDSSAEDIRSELRIAQASMRRQLGVRQARQK